MPSLAPPRRELASIRGLLPALALVNAGELFAGLDSLPGGRAAAPGHSSQAGRRSNGATGSHGDGILTSRLVNGIEYAQGVTSDERRLRSAFKRRRGGGATPLILVADEPDTPGLVRVLGPQPEGPLRRIRADSLLGVVQRTTDLSRLQAVRLVAEEVDRLDTERVAGVRVRGLGTEHLYARRLPGSARWTQLEDLVDGVSRSGWRELLADLGYTVERLPRQGYLARAGGRPAAVVHPRPSAAQFARLDDDGRLPEGALVAECQAHGARFGILAAGARLRLLAAGPGDVGTTTRYVELDAAALEPEMAPLLGLLSPPFLLDGGFDQLLAEARDYGRQLRERLDLVLRQHVLPVLGRELGRWAQAQGRELSDDAVRAELESAALTFVFRALFLLYAESAGHLPMTNRTYAAKSLTRIAERAHEERAAGDERSTALWDDVAGLVRRMRTGHAAWDLPPYNGELFSAHGAPGAPVLEEASIADAALGPALVALARDPEQPEVGADFSGLEVGHLGYVYEGLLSLRLSLADRDYLYDARRDRYFAASADQEPDARRGELLWLTDEGGRKGGGVYYTRTELVRHLVRGAVGPAFDRHLVEVRELARTDPDAAAQRLFEFFVLDPACGSAHFLVEVVDELADKIATLLGELALPSVRRALDALRGGAGQFGAGIEDTALLKRLVLKRCVYGVDVSPMGAEIAKVSLWLSTFVPGLSLAYLDHNVQTGNSLIGVTRAEAVAPPGEGGQVAMFGDSIAATVREAAATAAQLRAIDDTTPEEVSASRRADEELRDQVGGAQRVFDLWTAEPLGLAGARDEALMQGDDVIAGRPSPAADRAGELAARERFLHWPLAFAEVFARERPGFDAVVGNPPWEEVNLDELGFYVRYRPGLRSLPEQPRLRAIGELLEKRPELAERMAQERTRLTEVRPYFGLAGGYGASPGNLDLYELFCQRYRELLRGEGSLGVVLPRSAFLARGSAGFREWLFEQAPPRRLDFLLNRGSWAFDMEPRYSVALLLADRRTGEEKAPVGVAGVAASAAEFAAQVEAPPLKLQRSALGRRLEVPLLPSQAAADLLAKLRAGSPFPFGGGQWRCFPVQGDFNETSDRLLWENATSGRPLWKGGSFDQFDPHGAGERTCSPSEAALAKARKPRPGKESLLAADVPVEDRRAAVERGLARARVAFRDVTRATDSRTVRACLVPPDHFLTNTAPYLTFVDDDPCAQAACLALMNSLVFDWQARRFVEIHLNFFVLEGLSLPALDDERFTALARAAARLSCPDERFADFAAATGVGAGPLAEEERWRLRADIDAHVAHVWALSADELEVVFADFTLDAVPPAYRELVRERFGALAPKRA